MKRLEIIGNRSVQEDLFDLLEKKSLTRHYTLLPAVQGEGTSGPKMGDNVWPEENFLLVVYCDDREAQEIAATVREVKGYFPGEGIKVFASEADVLV